MILQGVFWWCVPVVDGQPPTDLEPVPAHRQEPRARQQDRLHDQQVDRRRQRRERHRVPQHPDALLSDAPLSCIHHRVSSFITYFCVCVCVFRFRVLPDCVSHYRVCCVCVYVCVCVFFFCTCVYWVFTGFQNWVPKLRSTSISWGGGALRPRFCAIATHRARPDRRQSSSVDRNHRISSLRPHYLLSLPPLAPPPPSSPLPSSPAPPPSHPPTYFTCTNHGIRPLSNYTIYTNQLWFGLRLAHSPFPILPRSPKSNAIEGKRSRSGIHLYYSP